MKVQFAMLPLVAAAAFVTPASANYFSTNGMTGLSRNVGSAPSPTPDDLRAIGDSDLGAGKSYYYDKTDGHWHEVKQGQQPPAPARPAPQNR